MTEFDLDRAFPETPARFHDSILTAFEKGEKLMKMRHKMISLAAVAAALAIVFAMAALAGDLTSPKPDVLTAPSLTPENQTELPEEEDRVQPTDAPFSTVPSTQTPVPTVLVTPAPTPTPPVGGWVYFSETCAGHDHDEVDCEGSVYHLWENCNGDLHHIRVSREDAEGMGLTLCPDCEAVSLLHMASPTPTPIPMGTILLGDSQADLVLYATEHGIYYHLLSDCSGMRNAGAMTLEQAEMSGKSACPTCITGPLATGDSGDLHDGERERFRAYSEQVFEACFGVPVTALGRDAYQGAYEKSSGGDETTLRIQWRDSSSASDYESSYWLTCRYRGLMLQSVTAEVNFRDAEQARALLEGGTLHPAIDSVGGLVRNFLGELCGTINRYDAKEGGWSDMELTQLLVTLDAQLVPVYCEFTHSIGEAGGQRSLMTQLWQLSSTADPKLCYFDYDALLG